MFIPSLSKLMKAPPNKNIKNKTKEGRIELIAGIDVQPWVNLIINMKKSFFLTKEKQQYDIKFLQQMDWLKCNREG